MNETAPRVIKIPAKPESVRQAELQRQLRVAAYCRVSTKEEDQANSYEVQKEYYTDKIMSNPVWTMAGIFADKGITGTSVKKREDFMRMIRHCRQRKIDVVLTKSVSRFARNTVDCLYYTRALKELGIAVIFEKENINSLEEDSELRITLSGAFAQSESESISANVTWGKRRAMESGKATIQYKYLYSDVATALIACDAEVEYIENGEIHRESVETLIARHTVTNGLSWHEHLPILVTRFIVPCSEAGERTGFYKYAMRTTIDFPLINFALRCCGSRGTKLVAGAVAPHPVVLEKTGERMDSGASDDEIVAVCCEELGKLAMPIKEACITPALKRNLYCHVAMLLKLRK